MHSQAEASQGPSVFQLNTAHQGPSTVSKQESRTRTIDEIINETGNSNQFEPAEQPSLEYTILEANNRNTKGGTMVTIDEHQSSFDYNSKDEYGHGEEKTPRKGPLYKVNMDGGLLEKTGKTAQAMSGDLSPDISQDYGQNLSGVVTNKLHSPHPGRRQASSS